MAKLESAAAFRDYIAELELRADISPSYLTACKQRLRALQAWLEDRTISANAAKQFLAEMRDREYKQKSIKAYYAAIKPFLEYLRIPFKMRFRHQKHLPAYHPSQDIDKLTAAADARADRWAHLKKERDKLIILTLAYTGLRRAELARLRPCDILNDYIHVRSGKGDKDRVIPLAEDLREPFLSYIQRENIGPSSPLFPIGPKHIYTIIRNYARAAGFDMSPHALRHYFATTLLERGAPLSAIQQLLGHASIATTAIYLDMVPAHLQSSVSLLSGSLSVSTPHNINKETTTNRSRSLSLSLSNEQTRKGGACSGSKSKRAKPSMPQSTSHRLRASSNTGPDREASSAWARAAPTASPETPSAGDTRPGLSSTDKITSGSSETRPW